MMQASLSKKLSRVISEADEDEDYEYEHSDDDDEADPAKAEEPPVHDEWSVHALPEHGAERRYLPSETLSALRAYSPGHSARADAERSRRTAHAAPPPRTCHMSHCSTSLPSQLAACR